MKPLTDGSTCQRSPSRVAVILIPTLLAFLSLTLFNSLSQAADDQTTKAVRRASPEGVSVKSQKRVALVIGNNEYKEAPLKNPAHDAEDIANVLRGLGFTVQTKINADQRGIEDAVKEFVREIQNGDVGLFYFSGHGVQVHGENYLMPVGGSIESETDVRYKAVNAGLILGKMEESRNRTNIFILDACRNNPFKGFRSLNKGLTMMDASAGTFIAYATAPGSVAADGTDRNSPYAKHLMQAIKKKGLGIEHVFKEVLREVRKETEGKQIPWIASSLQDDFYFDPSPLTSPSAKPSEGGKTEGEQEIAKLREAERVAALEKERLEKTKREHEQEIARLREFERVAVLEKAKIERERLEREVREREQELAKLREAQKIAALEKERFERERRELSARVSPAPTVPSSIISGSQVVEMTYSIFFPATHAHSLLATEWAKEIEKRTNGKVRINIFPGGTLTPADQCCDGVVRGISDIGMSVLSYAKGRFPLSEILDLPLGYKNGSQVTHLTNAYYAKFKPKELDEVKVMYLHGHGPGIIHTKSKPVNKLEDIKGMKIRCTGTSARIAAALGATPIAMPQTETYDALQKGVAEGVLGPIEILKGWKFGEIVKYTTQNYGTSYSIAFLVAMNKKKWDSLPRDVQETITSINKVWIEKTGKIWDDIDKEGAEFAVTRGDQIKPLSPEEDQRWTKLMEPIFTNYIGEMERKNLPGKEAVTFCREWLSKNK